MKKLGFGLMRLPTLDKNDPSKVDLEQLKQMVDLFLEKGFTYFDTAWMYNAFASESAAKTPTSATCPAPPEFRRLISVTASAQALCAHQRSAAVAGLHTRSCIAIGAVSLSSLLHHVQSLTVLHVARVCVAGNLILLPGLIQPSAAVGDADGEEVPLRVLSGSFP